MNFSKYLIRCFIGVILLSGCFKDHGHYDYNAPKSIQVDSIKSDYTVKLLIDTLRINPVITPADKKYSQFWGIYPYNLTGGIPVMDTISFEKDLEFPITLKPGNYVLIHGIRDLENGISNLTESKLYVTTQLSKGWYVFKDRDHRSDLDLHNEEGVIENVLSVNNEGFTLTGEVVDAMHSYNYQTYQEDIGYYMNTTVLMLASSEDACVMELSSGKVVRDWEGLFYSPPADKKIQALFKGGDGPHLLINGKLYGIDSYSGNSGRFGMAIPGDYDLDPYKASCGVYNSILYDKKNDRLIQASVSSVTGFVDPTLPDNPPVNRLNSEVLFSTPASFWDSFMMLKKKGSNQYQLRKFDLFSYEMTGDNINMGYWDLDDSFGITKGTHWTGYREYDGIFYACDNEVYYCNIAGNFLEAKQNTSHPANETITFMRHIVVSRRVDKLVIATHSEGAYKIYLYDILAGTLQPDPEVLSGEGRVGKVHYVDGNYASDNY